MSAAGPAWDRYIAAVTAGKTAEELGRLYWQAAETTQRIPDHIHCYVDVEVAMACSSCPARCLFVCDECGRRACGNHK